MNNSELIGNNPWIILSNQIKNNGFKLTEQNSLVEDKPIIQAFNHEQSETFRFRTSMMPAHFTGNILESKVVLLASNPGYVKEEEENFYSNPKFIKERIKDLTF